MGCSDPVAEAPPTHASRAGRQGYCPQQPQVYGRLTCDEHFELFGHAYRMAAATERESSAAIYAALGFEQYAVTRADQLSGGTLAKLNLGLALLSDPDVDTYQKFWDLVTERRHSGRSVLIISHFVVDADRFDRIVEVRGGRAVPR